MTRMRSDAGFSILELLVATGLLMVVSSIVTGAMLQMTKSQATIWNRTEMHSGIRGATELLQQEVGQAGKVSLPVTLSLAAAVAPLNPANPVCDPAFPATSAVTATVVSKNSAGTVVTSVLGIDPVTQAYGNINPLTMIYASAGPPAAYMLLTTMDGQDGESIKVASVNPGASTIDACFTRSHLAGTVLMPLGALGHGVIPNSGIPVAEQSTGTVLKLVGDINGDGNMVYVEYICDVPTRNLYRNVMPINTALADKPNGKTPDKVLLSNIVANPNDQANNPVPCFKYQTVQMPVQGSLLTFVLDVAVTLTVESEQIDPITKVRQTETKALLNVSPRNVFNAWTLASIGYTDRIQSIPTTVQALLP